MKTKRILSVLIMVAMLIGMLPTTVFAVETEATWSFGTTETAPSDAAYTYSGTLAEAFTAANGNEDTTNTITYVKLNKDVSMTHTSQDTALILNEGKAMVLDLNEKTFTSTSTTGGVTVYGIKTEENSFLTVKNGTISVSSSQDYAVGIESKGDLHVANCSINANAKYNATGIYWCAGKSTIENCEVNAMSTDSRARGIDMLAESPALTVADCTINASGVSSTYAFYPMNWSDVINLTIAGTVTATGSNGAFYSKPTTNPVTVTAGTSEGDATDADASTVATYKNNYVKLEPAHTHCICGETHKAVGDHTAEDEKTFNAISTYAELVEAAANGGNYYLANDIEITNEIEARPQEPFNLCLNGNTLFAADDMTGNIFDIRNNSLTLTDCVGGGKLTGTQASAVYVWNTFNMYGGAITENNGTGVYLAAEDAVFNMYGGEITNNKAYYGAGIYHADGTIRISGGTIAGNVAQNKGGAIYTRRDGIEICGNPVIAENYINSGADGEANQINNIDAYSFEIVGPMTDGASIGMTLVGEEFGFFAEDTYGNSADYSEYLYFFSDKGYPVYKEDAYYYFGYRITKQPRGTDYSVEVNATNGASYQWCEIIKGDPVPVDDTYLDGVTGEGMDTYDEANGWSAWVNSGVSMYFTIVMNPGDELTAKFASAPQGEVLLVNGITNSYALVVSGGENTYTFTAVDAGDHILVVFAADAPTVKATLTKNTLEEVDGQIAATLDTGDLPTGTYACQVTWDMGTPDDTSDDYILQSALVNYVLLHTHCICGATHASVGDHTVEDEKTFTAVSTYAELVAAATNGGNYYLANDIEINSTITVTGDLTLCLNGHTLKNTDDNTRVINIDGGTLNLTDCGSTGTITGGSLTSGVSYDYFGAGVKVTDGAFNMYGGIISGNTANYGGGVSVDYGSTFTLYDGTIRSNTATSGGGVYSQGTVTMHGGEISGNTAASGGGVFTGGTFTMHGGEITGNTANYGGGVDANNLNTIIAGGSIINNTANESPSGGIYTNQPMTLSGTPVIYGNKYGDNDGSFDICKFWSEIRVTEDFAPTSSPIRVFVDSTYNDCVFLETADSGMDVENYIDYFENVSEFPLYKKDGKYYAGFAIIEEPTSENNYTVKVTSEVDLSSQWCEKALVNKDLTNSDMSFIMDGMYDTDSQSFTMPYGRLQGDILLNAGDKLIVSSQSEIEALLDGMYTPAVERDGNTYTFTVTNTNAYMLMVSGGSGASVKLTKNGSDFVEVEGQTALTLDTTNLEEGEYKCKLVWDLGTDSTYDDIVTWSEVLTYTKPTYTITFASNGGSAVESKTCEYNQTITAPDAPTKEGFEFIAWYADDALTTKWNFETPVTENKTLYAKWVQGTVSNHGDHVDEVEVEGLNDIAKAEETDIKLVVQTEPITEDDTEQTAIKGITDAPNNFNFYDITLEKSTGGYVTDASSVIEIKLPYDFSRKTNIKVYRYHNDPPEELEQLEARATAPYADGKCFIDATNNCIYIYSLKFSTYAVAYDTVRSSSGGGVTRYTVKFDTDGGSKIASKTVTRNSKIAEPTVPEKEGYTFIGWFIDEEFTNAYDFESKITKNITLYAKWEKVEEQEPEDIDTHNCPSKAFDDLDIDAWYHEAVDYALENGIFKGIGETTFAPNDKLTRAMLVTVLYRMENEPATNRSIPFSDIDMGAYYANAVSWAKQNGIVNGVTENKFAPDESITREQIAAIIMRYAVYKGMETITLEENLHFSDADEISEYAVSSMNWAVGTGLINGKSESTLAPKDNATRIEVAAILHRFMEENK